jgi:hypothetical protein
MTDCICEPGRMCAMHAGERAAFDRLWSEPFLLMTAPDGERCVVPRCKTPSPTRWQVEVIGYQGRGEAPEQGPMFTACLSHLTQQMNRYLPIGGRRATG